LIDVIGVIGAFLLILGYLGATIGGSRTTTLVLGLLMVAIALPLKFSRERISPLQIAALASIAAILVYWVVS
jgi:hypothetical protein